MPNLYMEKFALAFVIFLSIINTSLAQSETDKKENLVWHTDLTKAQQISNSTRKPIFAFFTGSDWCGWCRKLQKEVFAKPEFIQWAQKNVVLLELDFPRNKTLPAELVQQNGSLQQVFKVSGFPTIWMFFITKDEADNKFNIAALGSLGYPQNPDPGKEEVKFLANANKILANGSAR